MRSGPLRHRWFSIFVGAFSLGAVADEIARLALPLLMLDITHSIASAAALRVVQGVPYILFGAPAGALIDRANKRLLLIACDAASIALTLVIPLSAALGFFSVELVYVIGFLLGTVEVMWGVTTDFSVVPSLVEEHELTEANAIFFGADRVARVLGPTVGGLAIAAFGNIGAMWIAALAFLPTLAIFWRMPPVYDIDRAAHTPLTVANVMREMGDGFRYLWQQPVLRWLVVVMSIANLGGVGLRTLLLYVLREEQHLDEITIGLTLSASGVALVLGSFLVPRLTRGRPMGQSMIASVLLSGLAALATAFTGDWRLVAAGFTAREVAWQAFIIFAFIPRQRVPAHLRGRANGAFRTIVLVSNSASPAVLSAIVVVASSAVAFAVAGGLGLLATAIGAASPLREYALREPAQEVISEAL
ncbi:MAG TPA: MFS transporter [Candidatus Limnocylindria bacterium]